MTDLYGKVDHLARFNAAKKRAKLSKAKTFVYKTKSGNKKYKFVTWANGVEAVKSVKSRKRSK
jgi:hypothetical protein